MNKEAIEAQGSDIEEAIQNGLRRLGLGRTDVIIDVIDEGRQGFLGLGSREATVRLTPLAGIEASEDEEVEEEVAAPPPAETASVVPELEPDVEPAEMVETAPEPEAEETALTEAPAALPAAEEMETPEPEEKAPEAPLAETAPALPEADASVPAAPAAAEEEAEAAPEEKDEAEPAGADEELVEAVQDVTRTLMGKMGFAGADVSVEYGEPDDRTGRVMTIVEIEGGSELNSLIGPHGEVLSDLQYITRLMTGHVIKRRASFLLDVNGYRRRREEALAKLAERMAGKAVRRGEPVTLEAMNAYDRRIIHIALRDNEEVYTNSVGEGADRRVRIYLQED